MVGREQLVSKFKVPVISGSFNCLRVMQSTIGALTFQKTSVRIKAIFQMPLLVFSWKCKRCCRFFRKDHLAEHTTTHAKALPWACPICHRGFQRQIAMRAHFQNEHVTNSSSGTNGDAKCCPLCSYKAASMKSLRVHFYNRLGNHVFYLLLF